MPEVLTDRNACDRYAHLLLLFYEILKINCFPELQSVLGEMLVVETRLDFSGVNGKAVDK